MPRWVWPIVLQLHNQAGVPSNPCTSFSSVANCHCGRSCMLRGQHFRCIQSPISHPFPPRRETQGARRNSNSNPNCQWKLQRFRHASSGEGAPEGRLTGPICSIRMGAQVAMAFSSCANYLSNGSLPRWKSTGLLVCSETSFGDLAAFSMNKWEYHFLRFAGSQVRPSPLGCPSHPLHMLPCRACVMFRIG